MPRVVRIINRFNLGGPTYNVAYLTKYLAPEFETLLIGGTKDESEADSEFIVRNLGIEPVIIPEMRRSINPVNDLEAYRKIKKIIREYKPDIVHTHASKAGTLGRLAAFACKVPAVFHTFHGHVFHSYFGRTETFIYKNIERYLARRTTCIVAISEKQKEELGSIHQICPENKIQVIPLGFDLKRFRENQEEKRKTFRNAYRLEEDEIAIAIVGRLVPVKNHALFLRAIKHVSEKSLKKIRAFVVGDGGERQAIEMMARNMNIHYSTGEEKSLLTFTSWIKEVDQVYAGVDIVALCSFNEGTPVSLIEAQASGKAVVSTRTGGIENILVPGEGGLLADVKDEKTFFHHLQSLVENKTTREKLSSYGSHYVSERFAYPRMVEEMAVLYRNLLI